MSRINARDEGDRRLGSSISWTTHAGLFLFYLVLYSFDCLFSFVLYWSVLNCSVSVMNECYPPWLLFQFYFDQPLDRWCPAAFLLGANIFLCYLSHLIHCICLNLSTVFVSVYKLYLSPDVLEQKRQIDCNRPVERCSRCCLPAGCKYISLIISTLFYQLYLSQFINCICLTL